MLNEKAEKRPSVPKQAAEKGVRKGKKRQGTTSVVPQVQSNQRGL
jgi:hypothetical protein